MMLERGGKAERSTLVFWMKIQCSIAVKAAWIVCPFYVSLMMQVKQETDSIFQVRISVSWVFAEERFILSFNKCKEVWMLLVKHC